jgi:uncharacterized membrane protein YeaQ/YmgE (transglycosylase-associated protein family)
VVGALARLAVPGPDPMPLWATVALGLVGSLLGGIVTWLFAGTPPGLLVAVLCSVILLILYRRLVQRRGITGPDARRPPTRGWWMPRPASPPAPTTEKLDRLLRAGVISPEEYMRARDQSGATQSESDGSR